MLERVSLFTSKRDFFLFLLACGIILTYSLLLEYQNYKKLTQFDSALVTATVLKQYTKTKEVESGKRKTYQVLKLKSDQGFSFYTTLNKNFPHAKEQEVEIEIWTDTINFYDYFTTFFAYTKEIRIHQEQSLKQKLSASLSQSHENEYIANIYQALYLATPLRYELQGVFSALGVSHLLALIGFHLGVLSALLFFLLKYPYKLLQQRYFPYRNSKADLFSIVAFFLLCYLLFLDSPASLLRAFAMLFIGFILYDRGIKIVSMLTLSLTLILLLSFFPRLLFSLGFWLSMSGVFYIFLFLIHFKHLHKYCQFILLPFLLYLLMLPFSLALFGSFSIYHPLSILWTTLFTLFYPLSLFFHLIGFADLLDGILESFIALGEIQRSVVFEIKWLFVHILLSFLGMWKKSFIYLLLLYSLSLFIYAVYQIT